MYVYHISIPRKNETCMIKLEKLRSELQHIKIELKLPFRNDRTLVNITKSTKPLILSMILGDMKLSTINQYLNLTLRNLKNTESTLTSCDLCSSENVLR